LKPLLDAAGVTWQTEHIVWDDYNPHPQLKSLPKEFVFVGSGFNQKEAVTAGLQEMVLLYPGELKARSDAAGQVIPLLQTSVDSGTVRWQELVQRTMFGAIAINPTLQHTPENERHVLAVRVTGPVNAVIVADVDLMGEQFFELRRQGIENLDFDNVTFLLNAVDQLAGDPSFIALRKRRPRHRTLEAVEAKTRAYETQRLAEMRQAEATADTRLKEAQGRLDTAVHDIQQRKDLDDQAKQVMIANVQAVENRRLQVARTTIEDEKQRQIDSSRADMENSVRGIQNTIKLLAVVLPPIPAVLLFLVVSVKRLARERIGVPVDRLVEEAGGGGTRADRAADEKAEEKTAVERAAEEPAGDNPPVDRAVGGKAGGNPPVDRTVDGEAGEKTADRTVDEKAGDHARLDRTADEPAGEKPTEPGA
jgi:ABC-2 type transport system permease protein